MWSAISDAFTNFITMVGELVTALTGTSGALAPLLPLFAIGIAISIFMVGFKAIKNTLLCYWWPQNALNSVNVYGFPSIYDNTERSPLLGTCNDYPLWSRGLCLEAVRTL